MDVSKETCSIPFLSQQGRESLHSQISKSSHVFRWRSLQVARAQFNSGAWLWPGWANAQTQRSMEQFRLAVNPRWTQSDKLGTEELLKELLKYPSWPLVPGKDSCCVQKNNQRLRDHFKAAALSGSCGWTSSCHHNAIIIFDVWSV